MPNATDPIDAAFNPYTPVADAPAEDAPPDAPEATSTPRNADGTFAPRAEAPATKGLPASLRREAKQVLGLSDDDLAELSPVEIRSEIRFAKLSQRLDRQGTGEGRSAQAAAPEPVADLLDADTTDYEKLVGVVNSLAARLKDVEEAAQHVPRMAQYLQSQQQRESLDLADTLDEFFAQHPQTYGTGTWEDVGRDSADFRFRQLMAEEAVKANRGRVKGLAAVLERLHGERTGQKAAVPARVAQSVVLPDVGDEVEVDRLYASGAGKLGRPTQRSGGPSAPGYDTALSEVDAILRKAEGRKGRSGNVVPGTLNGIPE